MQRATDALNVRVLVSRIVSLSLSVLMFEFFYTQLNFTSWYPLLVKKCLTFAAPAPNNVAL